MIPAALAARINDLARTRPTDIITGVARTIEATASQTWLQARSVVLQSLPHAEVRTDVEQLLDAWQMLAPQQPRLALAWALISASQAVQATRQEQIISLV